MYKKPSALSNLANGFVETHNELIGNIVIVIAYRYLV